MPASLVFSEEFNTRPKMSPDGGSDGTWQTRWFWGARSSDDRSDASYFSDASVGFDPFSVADGVLTVKAVPIGQSAATGAPRTFNVGDFPAVPYDLQISATISGGAGVALIKSGTGGLLLTGSNTYQGDTYHTAGGLLAVGSDTALGTGLSDLFTDVEAELPVVAP